MEHVRGSGRKALVTGGASGFGLAIANALRQAGAQVAVADVDESALGRQSQTDSELLALNMDVSSAVAVREGVAATVDRFGGLDTLVLCAGIIRGGPVEDVSEDDWDRTIAVNLKGAFLAAQAATPYLKASGRGRVVAISSDAGKRGWPERAAYCASKFGLIGLCESLAAELAANDVTVNCVCPSYCPYTGMGQMLMAKQAAQEGSEVADVIASIAASFPLHRCVEIADVVSMVMFLISDEASLLTGLAVDIDGGIRLGRPAGKSQDREAAK